MVTHPKGPKRAPRRTLCPTLRPDAALYPNKLGLCSGRVLGASSGLLSVALMHSTNSLLRDFELLPDVATVRLPTVCALFGVSGPTVWRWSRDGRLPPPIKRGGVTGWQVGALRRTLTQTTV